MRLINLDELLKFPIRIDHCDKENGNENFVLGIECVIEYAEELPTIDAVPVVRCKDCKYWGGHDGSGNSCTREFDWYGVSPDDFCSLGERREPNEN